MDNSELVAASKLLINERKKVRIMFRVEPINEIDSGWRFFCGDESADYLNDLNNIVWCNIDTVLRIDKSVYKYLDEGVDFT